MTPELIDQILGISPVWTVDQPGDTGVTNNCGSSALHYTDKLENLYHAFDNQVPHRCDFRTQHNPGFGAWNVPGSQNHSVMATAVGFHWAADERQVTESGTLSNITNIEWMKKFLRHQVGVESSPDPNAPHLKYKGGAEVTSNIYDAPVVASVAAVYYWATRVSDEASGEYQEVANLARDFLQATFMTYALAAGPTAG